MGVALRRLATADSASDCSGVEPSNQTKGM
jgi:hypothetical protein